MLFVLAASLLSMLNTGMTPLDVRGNRFVDGGGKPVRLQGVNIPSLEWSNTGDSQMLESVRVATTEWKSNVLRIPLCQDRWFGKAENQNDGGEDYRKTVDSVVAAAEQSGAYVLLDLHWSDAGEWGKNIAQHWMPDDGSVSFWRDCAKRFANRPCVLFDLYNEPHDVAWDAWLNGGDISEEWNGKHLHYHSPGMRGLLNAVRGSGARNAVLAAGLDWGYDLSGVLKGYALRDVRGRGVAYESHIYPWKGSWDEKVGLVAKQYPVLIGEVGCETDPKQEDPNTWAPKILKWIDENNLSWTAWCFHPDASPRLLKDWNYTPTTYWGSYVKKRLAGSR